MANLKSSQKDIRRIKRRTERNRVITTRLKTLRKKVLAAQQGAEGEAATEAGRVYVSALDKAAKTGIIHRNKANREKAKLAKIAKAATSTEVTA